ncbi:hypothetical protein E2C01_035247 [Portunus trituberculatus]|uniref:Uncharacterized protein n=1 Tax=Portunus trituberculatus TaxID=210409 RepID=A0A5B7F8P9_PORTR|nr:hypothetical protein [Portunus trituberculatus]
MYRATLSRLQLALSQSRVYLAVMSALRPQCLRHSCWTLELLALVRPNRLRPGRLPHIAHSKNQLW